ncbi:hypothetical protein GPLA_2472 [Paraglaciecola polaris LMG 21857]|uniref:Uncharacterized protein n=1 Tax=Paraglaciecola polaris LMG 21857 TaxID=1129793 RepID=K6YKZ6_9ALTE|nr:hypothetical protein GPLA_2472 [Paraglaciecola polaris LMG 21857]
MLANGNNQLNLAMRSMWINKEAGVSSLFITAKDTWAILSA